MEIAKGNSLKAVVGKVGFSSSAALSRAFKRRYGVSPRKDYALSG
jgi:AraC-like DNA-binding protein